MTLLVDRLGPVRAATVIDRAGGERIVIPPSAETGRGAFARLEQRFGRDVALALVIHFGGELVYVPNGRPSGGARRVELADVVRLTLESATADGIARELECSSRVVYMRRAEARALGLLPESWIAPTQVGHLSARR